MKNRTLKVSPLAVVLATALLVVASSVSANYFLGKSARTIDPHVMMEGESPAGEKAARDMDYRRRVVVTAMGGEVARTADRVAEAEALAVATSLYAATEQIKRRTPETVGDLLSGVSSQDLLPPGISLTRTEGALVSDHGSLFVRYRPVPLAIEVVALGREPKDGPAILVRVPDDNAKEGASLFLATRVSDVSIPQAFAPASAVIAEGWSPESFRGVNNSTFK